MIDQLIAATEFWSALIGAVVGAATGAIPSYVLAVRSTKKAKERDAERKLEQEKAAAYKCFSKLMHMANALMSVEKQLTAMASAGDDPAEPVSRRISAFAGISHADEMYFDSDEISLFVSARKVEYANRLQLFSRLNAAVLHALNDYKEAKAKLRDFLHAADITKFDPRGPTRFEMQQSDKYKMDIMERDLDALIQGIRQNLAVAIEISSELAGEFEPIMASYFGEGEIPALSFEQSKQESKADIKAK